VCLGGWVRHQGCLSGRISSVWHDLAVNPLLGNSSAKRCASCLVLDRLDDLQHLGDRLGPDGCEQSTLIANSVQAHCDTWSPPTTEER
jgi:hypothetical protein